MGAVNRQMKLKVMGMDEGEDQAPSTKLQRGKSAAQTYRAGKCLSLDLDSDPSDSRVLNPSHYALGKEESILL